MDRSARLAALATLAALCLAGGPAARAQDAGTRFTYQGAVKKDGVSYTGTCDFALSLWDAQGVGEPPAGGNQVAGENSFTNFPVTNGVFRLRPEFGAAAFNGDRRFLQVAVVCPTGGVDSVKTTLSPRQEVTPAPYAIALPGLVIQQNIFTPNLIGGYKGNTVTAGAIGATIAGGGNPNGFANEVTDDFGTVGGGFHNRAGDADVATDDSQGATVGGGSGNTASGPFSTVGGGVSNLASNVYSTVPGGLSNTASGQYSLAGGRRAKATHDGAFVWADSRNVDFVSASDNSFRVRATGGGVRFVLGIDGTTGASTWSCLANDGNSWSCSSDRNQKENLEDVDGREVLARLRALPLFRWNGKGRDPGVKHLGPTAQDFRSAFGLGEDDLHISTIDLDGVALAAIQGLYDAVQERDAEIEALKERLGALERRLGPASPE